MLVKYALGDMIMLNSYFTVMKYSKHCCSTGWREFRISKYPECEM